MTTTMSWKLYAGFVAAGAVVLAGCHGRREGSWVGPPGQKQVAQTLDCPDAQGDLRRVSAAPDGRSCQYFGARENQQVTLTLMDLNGAAPSAALAPVEARLRADAGPAFAFSPQAQGQPPQGQAIQNQATQNQATQNQSTSQGQEPAGRDHDQAHIDLPGFHVDAAGDKAQIKVLGMSITANGDTAHIQTGKIGNHEATIDAQPGGAVIRADNTGPRGADLVFILASEVPGANGNRAVGYLAKGPTTGPLVVATFESKTGGHGNATSSDVNRLVNRNVRRG